MGFIRGGFADLTGYKVGEFTVHSLAGRDRQGIPLWDVRCNRCHIYQQLPHRKLAAVVEAKAPSNIQCINAGCPLSRHSVPSESFSEFLKREKAAAEKTAKLAAERQEAAEREAARERAVQARLEPLRESYRTFWLAQMRTDQPESEIPPFKRWVEIGESARQVILNSLEKKWTF